MLVLVQANIEYKTQKVFTNVTRNMGRKMWTAKNIHMESGCWDPYVRKEREIPRRNPRMISLTFWTFTEAFTDKPILTFSSSLPSSV